MSKIGNGIKSSLPPFIGFIVIVGLWELVDFIFKIKEVIVPNPHEIAGAFIQHFPELIANTGFTVLEALVGFIFGSIIAFFTAIKFVYIKPLREAMYPWAVASYAVPVYALAPLLTIWFGNGMLPKMVMSALVGFFPVLVNSVRGLAAPSKDHFELFKSLKASKLQTLLHLRIPFALPHIFSSLKVASTLAVIGATVAEFMGSSHGIGHLIILSSYYIDTSLMFAAIMMISLAGVVFFKIISHIEKKVLFWHQER